VGEGRKQERKEREKNKKGEKGTIIDENKK
jgi:hypothetical protein